MDVSIIIVHYNTPELTSNCIRSVIEFTQNIEYEIIVVDNASTLHDPEELKFKFPAIQLIKSTSNLGFAGGNNLGISEATGKYILLLNSDTYLQENAVFKAYQYIKSQPQVGVVSVRLVFPDGSPQCACQRFPSVKYTLLELFRVQKLMGRKTRGRLLLGAYFDQEETLKVDWVWGTFFLFPRDLLRHLKDEKLDDSFFMYGEDMQWCWDISKLGYEIHFYAGAEVVHVMGGSNADKRSLMYKNVEEFKRRNLNRLQYRALYFLDRVLSLTTR